LRETSVQSTKESTGGQVECKAQDGSVFSARVVSLRATT